MRGMGTGLSLDYHVPEYENALFDPSKRDSTYPTLRAQSASYLGLITKAGPAQSQTEVGR
jgi:hypothetical protein